MPKKALVILAEGFEEIEAVTPIDILRRAGLEVTVASLGPLSVKGSRGITVNAEKKLSEAGLDFDAVILPGGSAGAKNLASSGEVAWIIKTMNQKEKIVAAICASPAVVLAPAGILENRKATCYPGMQDHFGKTTAYVEESVVCDGHVVTSRGAGTAIEFSLAIAEMLAGKETAEKVRGGIAAK